MLCDRKILCIVFCLLCIHAAYGQGGYDTKVIVKSPESYTYKTTPSDTASIKKEINLVADVIQRNMDSSLWLLTDALEKSKSIGYKYGIAMAMDNIGYCNVVKGNYAAGLQYYVQSIPYAKPSFSKNMMAKLYSNMSAPYFFLGKYDSMSYYGYLAERYIDYNACTTVAEVKRVVGVYLALSTLWSRLGDANKAKEFALKGLAITAPFKNDKDRILRNNIADIYVKMGSAYSGLHQRDSALYFLNTALQYDPEDALAMLTMGEILLNQKDYKKAVPILEKALSITAKNSNYGEYIIAKTILGKVYYQLKDYKKADTLLLYVVNAAAIKGNRENIFTAYKLLADIKAATGDYKQAYAYQQKSQQLFDSLKEEDKMKTIYDLELKSRTAQKDKQIAEEQLLLSRHSSQMREKNILLGAIGVGSVFFAIALIAVYRSSKHRQSLQTEQIYSMHKDQEVSNLKSMIRGEEKERTRLANELHDGIMVQLSTVKMNIKNLPEPYKQVSSQEYVNTPYYQQIVRQMEDATTELRRTAHNLMPDMLLQGGLTEAIYYFCTTLQQNTGLAISYQQHGDIPRLQKEFELSVYRIVQELLQNIMKHARAQKVIVQLAQVAEKTLAITIEDDGVGFNMQSLPKNGSMGLKSITTRVQVLNGLLDIRSHEGEGTTVHMEFEMPLID